MVVKMKKARCIVALIVVIMMVITLMPSSRNTAEAATSKPLDIVLVLDTSSSMLTSASNKDSTEKWKVMQWGVNDFLDRVYEANQKIADTDKHHRVCIIDYNKITVVNSDHRKVSSSSDLSYLKNIVNELSAAKGTETRTNDALKDAYSEVSSVDSSSYNRAVILLTGGQPKDSRTDNKVDKHYGSSRKRAAGKAVHYAYYVKSLGVNIYTIGLFKGADQSDTDTDTANGFLNAVSSSYPDAYPIRRILFDGFNEPSFSERGWYDGFSLGDSGSWEDYFYLVASDKDDLPRTFKGILSHMLWTSERDSAAPASESSEYSITATVAEGDTIRSTGTTTVASGGSLQYTITAKEGYKTSDVQVDGNSVGAVSSYEFTDVTANHTIRAVFEKVEQAGASSGDNDSDVAGTITNTGSANTTGGSSGSGSTATGDDSNPALWVALAMMALMGAATTVIYRRKKS